MHFLDEIEGINAREWNAISDRSNPALPRTECQLNKKTEPGYAGPATGHQLVSRQNGNRAVPSGRFDTYGHIGRKDPSTFFNPRKIRTFHGHTLYGAPQTMRNREWSKTYAVNTRRMQAHRDQEAEKAFQDIKFIGQPSEKKFPAVGYYRWSDSTCTPSMLLGENLQLLDDVRTGHEVFIDYEQHLGCIRVRSYHLLNVEKGIAGLKAKIRHAETDVAALAPLYMVEPPSSPAMMSEVSPKFMRNENIHRQLVVERVVFTGPRLSTKQAALLETESKTILKANQELFSRHLKQAMASLQKLRSGVHMRVSFGKFHLLMYRKDFRESPYSFQKFSNMMSESRTKASFNQRIRVGGFGTELLNSMKRANTVFEPADSITPCLAAVEPKHSLIVVAHGSPGAKLRVEADMDMVDDASEELGRKIWQLGATIYYTEKDRKSRFTAGTISLESFDWCFEITSEETLLNPPEAFKEILAAVALSSSVNGLEGTDFSFPLVTPRIPHGVTIDEYWMRSILRYQLVGTSYITEIAIYRGWFNEDLNGDLSTEFRINLYHPGWDFLTDPERDAMHHNDWIWNSFFPANSASEDGFYDFLAVVRNVQSVLSRPYSISQGAR